MDKRKIEKHFEVLISKWIDWGLNNLNEYVNFPELRGFKTRYQKVLDSAKRQIDKKAHEIIQLYDKLENRKISDESEIFKVYLDTLSFEVQEGSDTEKIFLPSFSDEMFKEITKLSLIAFSPYRGIHYSWKLGEIWSLFANQKTDRGINSLLNLYSEVEDDYFLQRDGYGNLRYNEYIEFLNKLNEENIPEMIKHQIKLIKLSMRNIFSIKASFISSFLYPSKTSTHFYMSGIRFYWYPLLVAKGSNEEFNKGKFYIQSTDSGIFKLEEHYGTLIDSNEVTAWKELIEKLPPGSLLIDLTTEDVSDIDIENIKYFETWSYLITLETYNLVSKTLNMIDLGFKEKGIAFFMNEVRKNPMRKFYFDTGIYGAAKLAGKKEYPRISYLTTNRSKVPDPYFDVSKQLWEQFMDTGGIDYYLLEEDGWRGDYQRFANLTLIPSNDLGKFTNFLLSIRDKNSRKIAHGIESVGAYLVQTNIKEIRGSVLPEDIIPVIFNFYKPDISPLVSFAIPFIGKLIRIILKAKQIERELGSIEAVRENDIARKITKNNVSLLKSKT